MVKKEEKYAEFLEKRKAMISFGLKQGFIKAYDDELIERLRGVSYGGIPASIIILCEELCDGNCYDRASLITLGFGDDDFCLVRADINGLKLNPKNNKKEQHNHCFVERKEKDGKTWVYDTSLGVAFEKSLYYQIEEPVVTKISTKNEVMDYLNDEFLKDEKSVSKNLASAVVLIPTLEKFAKNAKGLYKKQLKDEVELFKQKLDYEKERKNFKKEVQAHKEEHGPIF